MQEQFRRFSEERNLWHGRKVATNQDLVGLFIVRAVEKYLNDGGTFAFLTPLAVLSRQQYEGFRAGKWGHHLRGRLTELWDLEDVRPKGDLFPVPAAVVFGQRDTRKTGIDQPDVPHGTTSTKLKVTGLRDVSGWAATSPNLSFTPTKLVTITRDGQGEGSQYRKGVTQGANIVQRVLLFIHEEAAASRLGMSSGRVNYRSMRTNQEKAPWKSLPDLTGVIERRFIFDVHLGSTLVPFRTLEPWRAILPIEKGRLLDEERIDSTERSLSQWWAEATTLWETHRGKASKLSLWGQINYQNKLKKQLGAPTQRVVYTKS